jgi:integrative and conjugative element protein (TIGR02256 family)
VPSPQYIVIPVAVSRSIAAARAERLPRETGGFLIGQRRGQHFEILNCTHQAPGDIATPTSFSRLSRQHANAVEEAWRKSEGLHSIVGDWHSHPLGSALPSHIDRRAWKALFKAMSDPGIGVIAANGDTRVFYFTMRWGQLRVAECERIETNDGEAVFSPRV